MSGDIRAENASPTETSLLGFADRTHEKNDKFNTYGMDEWARDEELSTLDERMKITAVGTKSGF